jgi:hypothetical protein
MKPLDKSVTHVSPHSDTDRSCAMGLTVGQTGTLITLVQLKRTRFTGSLVLEILAGFRCTRDMKKKTVVTSQ